MVKVTIVSVSFPLKSPVRTGLNTCSTYIVHFESGRESAEPLQVDMGDIIFWDDVLALRE